MNEAVLEPLFAVPPGEFVAARNRLAAELKKAGKKAEAEAIKGVGKPPVSVYALNQIARQHGDVLGAYLDAAAALADAQTAPGSDKARAAFKDALARQRDAESQVMALVPDVLAPAGLSASRAVLDRIAQDLRYGVLTNATRELLRQGRLLTDVDAPDFSELAAETFGGEAPAAPAPRHLALVPPAKQETATAPAKNKAAINRAREQVRQAAAALKKAETEANHAEKQLSIRKLAHERTEKRRAELADELRAAEAELDKAAAAHEEANAAHAEAESARATAAETLAEAQKELERVEEG